MASDSRVSWINSLGIPIRWIDQKDFRKSVTIDGVIYGFAGTNAMFKMFLMMYSGKASSEFLLDTIVEKARVMAIQFFIIRYDGEKLRLFAYSPKNEQNQEIYRISINPAIDQSFYAIGSGSQSKEYKRNRLNTSAVLPIRKIIKANFAGMKKKGMLQLNEKVLKEDVSPEESKDAYFACQENGGDLFTGGEVKMSQLNTNTDIKKQINIMNNMDLKAKANNSVCASPINAGLAIEQLHRIGQFSVSPERVEMTSKRKALFIEMDNILGESI
jgi:hypothetical protein